MKNLKFGIIAWLIPVMLWLPLNATWAGRQVFEISGQTMGTFYTVKLISGKKESPRFWKTRIDTLLKKVNKKFSMYDPGSELSAFNREPANRRIRLSRDFYAILTTAKELHRMTGGAWDGTLKPLVDLWGFGTQGRADTVPDADEVNRIRAATGFDKITLPGVGAAEKTADVTLDLGSIAKGYGVDAVLELVTASGIPDVLVEIGGELAASGKNKKRQPWTVGINRPDKNLAGRLYKIIRLDNQSIATSGNYRNFFEADGKTYSHIIDPRTGYPTDNGIVSASVIAGSCAFADGLATALMVMDVEQGLDLVNRLENTECLIVRQESGKLVDYPSKGFSRLLPD